MDGGDQIALECPDCGYNLRGLIAISTDVVRCPECGKLTSMLSMAQERVRRRRTGMEMVAAIVLG